MKRCKAVQNIFFIFWLLCWAAPFMLFFVSWNHFHITFLFSRFAWENSCAAFTIPSCRFDHYCVWLGNSVGAKNHLYFLLFCLCQFFSQLFVFYWAIRFLWGVLTRNTTHVVANFFPYKEPVWKERVKTTKAWERNDNRCKQKLYFPKKKSSHS